MSKRLYPILVIALMASLVLPRVVSPLRAQEIGDKVRLSREGSAEQRQNNQAFVERLRNSQQDRAREIRELARQKAEEAREKRADPLEQRADNLEEFGSRLQQRFTLYKTRLSMVIDVLQSRLEKLEAAGRDTSEAQAKLDEAQEKLAEASDSGSASVQVFTSVQAGDTSIQLNEITTAHEKVQVTRENYAEVMSILKEAIVIIRAL